jgi:hypothetical protein
MGTTSADFHDSDIACLIRLEYPEHLRAGMSARQATKAILAAWAEELADETQDGVVVWLALAQIQWKYGRLEQRVKTKALQCIQRGGDVESFPPNLQKRRTKVLEKIRVQLESPPPPEKPVRIKKPVQSIRGHDQDLWKVGQVVAVVEALQQLGGRGSMLDISRPVWDRHEPDIRAAGDLLYEWQYELRWAGDILRRDGVLRPTEDVPRGIWELA